MITKILKFTSYFLFLIPILFFQGCKTTSGIGDSGYYAIKAGNYEKAFKFYEPLAAQGNARAQNDLAIMYNKGLGVKKNSQKAIKLWKLSAEKGYSRAWVNLGAEYVKGDIILQNFDEAFRLFKLASDKGDRFGQNWLARMYETGRGVNKNLKQANRLYTLAAKQGLDYAKKKLILLKNKLGTSEEYKSPKPQN